MRQTLILMVILFASLASGGGEVPIGQSQLSYLARLLAGIEKSEDVPPVDMAAALPYLSEHQSEIQKCLVEEKSDPKKLRACLLAAAGKLSEEVWRRSNYPLAAPACR